HRQAAAVMNLPDIPVRDLAEDRKRVTHSTDLERTALLLFAAAVVLAGVVLVGQALTRTGYSMAEPVGALRALGFTRPDMVRGLVSPMVITAVTASVVAIGSAVALSARFPVGLGAGLALEPGRGDLSLPVRPAIAGAVAGILGIVGALGLVHGIDDALAQPRRSGQAWDATV